VIPEESRGAKGSRTDLVPEGLEGTGIRRAKGSRTDLVPEGLEGTVWYNSPYGRKMVPGFIEGLENRPLL